MIYCFTTQEYSKLLGIKKMSQFLYIDIVTK